MRKSMCLLMAAVLSSAVFAKVPQWVKNPAKVYPAKEYFTAVGNGKTQQQAELAAVENLAAIFGRKVKSVASTSTRMQQATQNGTVSTGKNTDFAQNITQKVSVEDLIGIELREYYCDGDKHYALAVMDKKETEKILLSSISSNNSRIEKLLCAKPQDLYSLETYARYDFGREIAELDEKMLSKLEVINILSAEKIRKELYTSASIKNQMIELAGMIPIEVKIEGDSGQKMFQAVSEMFGQFGFRVNDMGGTRYSFIGKTERFDREADDRKTIQCIYSFEGQLKDSAKMEYLWSTSFSGRESSGDRALLPSKTDRKMASKVKNVCGDSFGKFLGNMKAE